MTTKSLGLVSMSDRQGMFESPFGRIMDEADPDCCYIGYPKHLKDATSAATWLIIRFKRVDGITYAGLADGDYKYDNIFDNRATLDYYPQEP